MQLAPTDTVLFTFAFWPTINISKNRHRDRFLFSFLFFFSFPSERQTAIYPGYQFLPLIFPSSLWLFGAVIRTNTTGEQPLYCAPPRAQTTSNSLELFCHSCLRPETRTVIPRWVIHARTPLPIPGEDASASLLNGFGVAKWWPGMERNA